MPVGGHQAAGVSLSQPGADLLWFYYITTLSAIHRKQLIEKNENIFLQHLC